jgi:hypothetical protein
LNSFFGLLVEDPIQLNSGHRFFGTSAAAPNVAAVALLMKQANPKLPATAIYDILENTAIDMNDPNGFDYESGYGFVNAKAAIDQVVVDKNKVKNEKKQIYGVPEYCDYTVVAADDASDVVVGLNVKSNGKKLRA